MDGLFTHWKEKLNLELPNFLFTSVVLLAYPPFSGGLRSKLEKHKTQSVYLFQEILLVIKTCWRIPWEKTEMC